MSTKNPICCNEESKWVENIPGKGYFFCKTCRNEVVVVDSKEKKEDTKEINTDYIFNYWNMIG